MYYLLWSCVSSFGKSPIGLNALIKYYYTTTVHAVDSRPYKSNPDRNRFRYSDGDTAYMNGYHEESGTPNTGGTITV